MAIHWELKVKFRFMFIDIGKLEKSGDIPLPVPPIPVPIPPIDKVVVNERGVYLRVTVG